MFLQIGDQEYVLLQTFHIRCLLPVLIGPSALAEIDVTTVCHISLCAGVFLDVSSAAFMCVHVPVQV